MKYAATLTLSVLLCACGPVPQRMVIRLRHSTWNSDGGSTGSDGSVGGSCGEAFLDLSDAVSPADGLPPPPSASNALMTP